MQSIYINNGVEVLAAKKRWDSNRKKICIGFAGILTEQKAPALFSEIAFVFAENTRVVFKWIGDGPLRHELKAVNIELTGWVEDEHQVREEL